MRTLVDFAADHAKDGFADIKTVGELLDMLTLRGLPRDTPITARLGRGRPNRRIRAYLGEAPDGVFLTVEAKAKRH